MSGINDAFYQDTRQKSQLSPFGDGCDRRRWVDRPGKFDVRGHAREELPASTPEEHASSSQRGPPAGGVVSTGLGSRSSSRSIRRRRSSMTFLMSSSLSTTRG